MGYRVKKRGKNYWMFGQVKGLRIDSSLRTSNKRLAEEIAKEKFRRALEQTHGIKMIRPISFKVLLDKYYEYCRNNNKKSTYEKKIFNIQNLVTYFGDIPISNITVEQIEEFKNQRLTQVSASTVNRDLSTLKHALNLAMKWGYLEKSAAALISKFREPAGRIRFLSTEEADRLISKCSKELKPIVITALNTGMRLGEILGLDWEKIDLEKHLIKIFDTKNNEFRVVPINETLYNVLVSMNGKKGKVFLSRLGQPYSYIYVGFRSALKKAEIERFTFHDLRHTFASWLAMKGVPLSTIGAILGHKTPQMTMRYAHLSPDYLKESVELLTQK